MTKPLQMCMDCMSYFVEEEGQESNEQDYTRCFFCSDNVYDEEQLIAAFNRHRFPEESFNDHGMFRRSLLPITQKMKQHNLTLFYVLHDNHNCRNTLLYYAGNPIRDFDPVYGWRLCDGEGVAIDGNGVFATTPSPLRNPDAHFWFNAWTGDGGDDGRDLTCVSVLYPESSDNEDEMRRATLSVGSSDRLIWSDWLRSESDEVRGYAVLLSMDPRGPSKSKTYKTYDQGVNPIANIFDNARVTQTDPIIDRKKAGNQ